MTQPPKKLSDSEQEPDDDGMPAAKLKKSSGGVGDGAASLLGADNDAGTRGLALSGAHPAAVILNGVATIEQQIKAMARFLPQILHIGAPLVEQLKAAAVSGLADLASGGMGAANMGAGAGAGMPPGMPPGAPPAGMGMPMTPPPPPM